MMSETSEASSEIVLSVYWKRGKLGAAYYKCNGAELHLLNDVVDMRPDFNKLRTLVCQAQPSVLTFPGELKEKMGMGRKGTKELFHYFHFSQILTCGGLSDDFVKVLSNCMNQTARHVLGKNPSKRIFFMTTKKEELSYEACKRSILRLRLGSEPDRLNEEDHVLFVNSHIDLAQESMVFSLGMLVKYLEKYLSQIDLNYGSFRIQFLSHVVLTDSVTMDDNTYKALQIFNVRVRPSAFKRSTSGSDREDLSLFGIFNCCKSNAGMKRMREIFRTPSKNIEDLNERLDAVEFCCKPQHRHIVKAMVDCIKRVQSVTRTLTRILRARGNVRHWRSLYGSLCNAILIGEICQKYSSHSKLLEKVAKSITANFHEVTYYINRVINFERSSSKKRFPVRKGIHVRLDLLRETYARIPDILVKMAELELQDLPDFIEQCSIVYITEFIVKNHVHYKTPRCVELDRALGDFVASISIIESEIVLRLIQFIHTRITDVVKAFRLIAELDCVISLATVAADNNYRRPVLTKERKLEIVLGRHPLQEHCADNFISNDTRLGFGDGFIKILTGPNASGKSVYLKQVALIVYLAHIGSFVPAQSATVPILDHIHSRVQSLESISTGMSTFVTDLKQMSSALYGSTPRSLIVIDEFGKGTTEIDGLSVLAASLDHFAEREESCPFVLVSTHFHGLPSLLPSTPLIHLQHMEYFIENEELIYLRKTSNGTFGIGLTHLAAKAAGLTEEAVNRSLKVLNGTIPLESNPKHEITKTMSKLPEEHLKVGR